MTTPASFGTWIAVGHELPVAGRRVLVFGIDLYCTEREIHEAQLCEDGQWRTRASYPAAPDENVELDAVSHWMPFPQPPEP